MNDERSFLHEIANKVAIVYCTLDLLLESVKTHPGLSPKELSQLEKASETMNKIADIVKARHQKVASEVKKDAA